jgi:NitT/TauT family transport system substrate-binding protein
MGRSTARLLLGALLTALACQPAPAAGPTPAAGAGAAAAPAPEAAPPAAERLRVVYVTRNGAMGPLWVAYEAGLFARHGIDAELTYISSGTLGMQALLAREVDIGVIGASAVVAANLNGADAIYIGAIQRTFGQWIYSHPDLRTPTDLIGKRVGITRRNSTTDVALGFYLRRHGLVPDRDVYVVEVGDQAAMVPAMQTGAIQAAVLAEPATFAARSEGFYELADLTLLGVDYPQSALTTTRRFATEHRDLVLRFMRAIYEGTHRYKTDRPFALQVLSKYLQTDDPEVLAGVYATYAERLVQDVPRATYEGTRTVLAEVAATNDQARSADPARFLDLSFIEALDREGLEQRLYGRSAAPPAVAR